MTRLNEIENEFQSISKSSNIQGDVVDLLVKLVSYNVFKNELSNKITSLELSPNRQININSKIEAAVNSMYSIFRGKNPTIEFNIRITGDLTLSTYDKLYSDNYNTFIYSHAINNSSGETILGEHNFIYGQIYTIVGIKSKNFIEETLTNNSYTPHILETVSNNISEDFLLTSSLSSDLILKTTKIFGEHLDSSNNDSLEDINKLIFNLTTSGFGARFYSPISGGFNLGIDYSIKYIKYDPTPVDERSLTKLSLSGAEIDFDSITIKTAEYRETTEDLLYKLKKNLITQSRVRTNSDILDLFKTLYGHKIKDIIVDNYDIDLNQLNINYIPIDSQGLNPSTQVTDEEIDFYKNNLLYYVTKNINIIPKYDFDSGINISIDVKIKTRYNIIPQELIDFISNSEYKFEKSLNINKILGIVNSIEKVEYSFCEMKDENGNVIETVDSGKNNYFILRPNFTYSFITS